MPVFLQYRRNLEKQNLVCIETVVRKCWFWAKINPNDAPLIVDFDRISWQNFCLQKAQVSQFNFQFNGIQG